MHHPLLHIFDPEPSIEMLQWEGGRYMDGIQLTAEGSEDRNTYIGAEVFR